MGKISNRQLTKDDIQIENMYMERCSMPRVIKELKIKTTVKPHSMLRKGTV